MNIKGRVHCFFEQSGTFKNEFIKLGIPAEDYDLQNDFGETDHEIDLFHEIVEAYKRGGVSVFDSITKDDLIMAFFPCIHFCDAKVMMFKGVHLGQKSWSMLQIIDNNIELNETRNLFFRTLLQLVSVCLRRKLRLIIENPWNTSGMTYLQNNFFNPSLIDKNRALRGDYYVKPTAYWFFGCTPTRGFTEQINPNPKIVYKQHGNRHATGICDSERSAISPDYARNFICDNIIGKSQTLSQLTLFE